MNSNIAIFPKMQVFGLSQILIILVFHPEQSRRSVQLSELVAPNLHACSVLVVKKVVNPLDQHSSLRNNIFI